MKSNLRSMPRTDKGISNLSLVVSMVMVAIMSVAVMAAVTAYSRATAQAALESQAADAAQSVFELANATPWQELALSSDDADLSGAKVVSLAAGQPLVTLDPGAFEMFDPTAAKIEGGTENFGTINDKFTVYTSITWEEEPDVSTVTGMHTATFGTKRIAVEVVWSDGERGSQTYSTLRSPTIAEAAPTNINVVAGGGLTVERDINSPILVGDDVTGALEATITEAYKWEIQMSKTPSFVSPQKLCGTEFSEVISTVEDCTYGWTNTIGLTPSFRIKVWTHDIDDSDSSTDGAKYSNVVSFAGPTIAELTGGKTSWNQEQAFWDVTKGLMDAPNRGATVETAVARKVSGQADTITVTPYNRAGGTQSWETVEGESASYQVCTRVNNVTVVCSGWYGPLYTVKTPEAPALAGSRPWGSFHANFSWTSNADSYTGDGGLGLVYDIQQESSTGTWENIALDTTVTSLSDVQPNTLAGSSYLDTTLSLRVRAQNDAGFSPWATKTVTVGELPTKPTVSVSSLSSQSGGSRTRATWSWTAGSYARAGYQYQTATSWGGYGGASSLSSRRYKSYDGTKGDYRKLHVRSANEFGVSGWTYGPAVGVYYDSKPSSSPNVSLSGRRGYVRDSWTGVSNADSYELLWYVNDTSNRLSWSTSDASRRSVNITGGGVSEGDRVTAVMRAVNSWGAGPWSSWTGWEYSDMRWVGRPYVYSKPHLSGGYYWWGSQSCDWGSQAQYRVYNAGYWRGWGTSRNYTEYIPYGSSGAIYVQQRCINTTTNRASTGGTRRAEVAYRLLPNTYSYHDYRVSDWNNNNWKRLEQMLDGYDSGIAISGSHFGRYPADEIWANFWYETKILQRWLNWRIWGNNITVDGYWGPDTTNLLRDVMSARCSIHVGSTSYNRNAFDEYEMHRLTYCLNEGMS